MMSVDCRIFTMLAIAHVLWSMKDMFRLDAALVELVVKANLCFLASPSLQLHYLAIN